MQGHGKQITLIAINMLLASQAAVEVEGTVAVEVVVLPTEKVALVAVAAHGQGGSNQHTAQGLAAKTAT